MTVRRRAAGSGSLGGGPLQRVVFVTNSVDDALYIYDASSPSTLTLLGTLVDTTDLFTARGVCLSEKQKVAFIGINSGLAAVDVSDPTSPSVLSKVATSYTVWDVCIDDVNDVVYGTSRDGDRLASFDVSSPNSMSELDNVSADTPCEPILDESGDYVFCVGFSGGTNFYSYDVSDPTVLTSADSLAGPYNPRTHGYDPLLDFIFVPGYTSSYTFETMDVSNPLVLSFSQSRPNLTSYAGFCEIDPDRQVGFVPSYYGGSISSFSYATNSIVTSESSVSPGINDVWKGVYDPVEEVLWIATNAGTPYVAAIDVSNINSMSVLDTIAFPLSHTTGQCSGLEVGEV